MPLLVVAMALDNYFGMRFFRLEGAYSEGTQTSTGFVARSKFANRFLQLLLLTLLDWVLGRWPRMQVVLYVDDSKLKIIGALREVCNMLPKAVEALIK